MFEFIESLMHYIQSNVAYAPYLSFGLLCLAGFNIPVSEDGMIFINALLAAKHPQYTYQLFAGVFLGAYASDLICYALGRKLGPKLWKIRFFAKMVDPKMVDKVSNFYKKYGIFTLLIGRFIPFGVRNALFLTAGLGKMSFKKFALSDLLACIVSCTLFFTIYFHYGADVIAIIKKFNIFIFSLAAIICCFFIGRKYYRKKSNSLTSSN